MRFVPRSIRGRMMALSLCATLIALLIAGVVIVQVLERVYENDADTDSNSLEVIVGRLRKKIGAQLIETVRGRGYRLTAEAS